MKVEVIDGLAATLETVCDQAEPRLLQAKSASQVDGSVLEPAQQSTVIGSDVEKSGYVLARDHQYVYRGLRIDVVEGYDLVVLVDQLSRNLAAGDFAE